MNIYYKVRGSTDLERAAHSRKNDEPCMELSQYIGWMGCWSFKKHKFMISNFFFISKINFRFHSKSDVCPLRSSLLLVLLATKDPVRASVANGAGLFAPSR